MREHEEESCPVEEEDDDDEEDEEETGEQAGSICTSCGAAATAHTWQDGWTEPLFDRKCETCYAAANPSWPEVAVAVEEVKDDDKEQEQEEQDYIVEAIVKKKVKGGKSLYQLCQY